MSRIYFHSPSDTAEVSGSERAYFSNLVAKIGSNIFDLDRDVEWLKSLIKSEEEVWVKNGRDLALFFRVPPLERTYFQTPKGDVDISHLILNTAMRVGSMPVKLAAKIHAQCEIHCWVDGPNRIWLADIIEEGLEDNIFRSGMGWDSVVSLLKARADEPVVCSYSVCEQFPNSGIAGWKPPEDDSENYDLWYDLPDDEKWKMAMSGLKNAGGCLEISPDSLPTDGFGCMLSAFDLIAMHNEEVRLKEEARKKAVREECARTGKLPSIMDL